jgi:ribulose kinase
LSDLAKKYNLTLEAIALQTRHIVDEMNSKGHKITSIYVSGSQAKNGPMMQLISDACGLPVVLPYSYSTTVVQGAAMLGRFAAEVGSQHLTWEQQAPALWKIMVHGLGIFYSHTHAPGLIRLR